MRKRLFALIFGFLIAVMWPAGFALAHGNGSGHGHDDGHHDGDHHDGDCGDDGHHGDDHGDCEDDQGDHDGHHDGDHGDDGGDGDHHDGDHHDGDHHDGDCGGSGGGGNPPPTTTCPCVAVLPLFAQLVNGQATVADCIDATTTTSVLTDMGTFVITDSGALPPYCSVGASPPFISVTAAEALVCRDLLRQSATAQSIACHPPE